MFIVICLFCVQISVTHQLSFIVHEEIRVSTPQKNVMVTLTATTRRMKQSAVSSHTSVLLAAKLGRG